MGDKAFDIIRYRASLSNSARTIWLPALVIVIHRDTNANGLLNY